MIFRFWVSETVEAVFWLIIGFGYVDVHFVFFFMVNKKTNNNNNLQNKIKMYSDITNTSPQIHIFIIPDFSNSLLILHLIHQYLLLYYFWYLE
jgi:hypothetical protein